MESAQVSADSGVRSGDSRIRDSAWQDRIGAMWLNLEAGVARSLHRRWKVPIDVPPSPDPRWQGRRSLVVEAAYTCLPEADLDGLPELARTEIADGLGGRLRLRIAATDVDDPQLQRWRDELVAGLGGTADVTGALRLTDRIYAGRLLRDQVPPIVTASCLLWPGHWRAGDGGPSVAAARVLHEAVAAWTAHPGQRAGLDARIVSEASTLAGDHSVALEDLSV